MTVLLIAFAALVGLVLLAAGIVVGCAVFSYGDRQLEIVTSRLIAEQRVEAATRATLQAMRDAAKRYNR